MALTQPVDSYPNLVQNDLPVSSSIGIDPDQALPHTNQATQDTQQELSSDQLDSPGFDWSVDEDNIAYFSSLMDNRVDNLPYSSLQSSLPEGLGLLSIMQNG